MTHDIKLPAVIVERYWRKVDRTGGPEACWTHPRERVHIIGNIAKQTRHVALYLEYGAWPVARREVLTTCDTLRCVNPRHLIVGTPVERFWMYVKKAPGDACWEWTASTIAGYGQLCLEYGQQMRANRFSWELHHGAIPDGMFVCHRCDNPLCVRPDHLFLGTNADNIHDMIAKGRNSRGAAHGAKVREARNRKRALFLKSDGEGGGNG